MSKHTLEADGMVSIREIVELLQQRPEGFPPRPHAPVVTMTRPSQPLPSPESEVGEECWDENTLEVA
jgi:hypothetical protein